MRKLILPATIILLTALFSYIVFAQERIPHDANAEIPQCTGDNTIAGRIADYCPIRLAMAESQLQRQMVTNADGGIIILAGDKLLKYDKDLNLLRKVDMDIDINPHISQDSQNFTCKMA